MKASSTSMNFFLLFLAHAPWQFCFYIFSGSLFPLLISLFKLSLRVLFPGPRSRSRSFAFSFLRTFDSQHVRTLIIFRRCPQLWGCQYLSKCYHTRILHKYSATHSMYSASHSNVPNSTMDCTKIMSWTSDAAYQHLICVTSRHVCLSQGHSTTYALRIERLLCRSQDWCCRLKFQIWS